VRFAGIDIGSEEHVVAVLDEKSEVIVKATTFTEDAAGYGDRVRGAGQAPGRAGRVARHDGGHRTLLEEPVRRPRR
jgi:hypothetical protein